MQNFFYGNLKCICTFYMLLPLLYHRLLKSCFAEERSHLSCIVNIIPYNNVHGANMGPIWVLSAPDGPHVGPMNLVIRDGLWYAGDNGNQSIHSSGIGSVCPEWIMNERFQVKSIDIHIIFNEQNHIEETERYITWTYKETIYSIWKQEYCVHIIMNIKEKLQIQQSLSYGGKMTLKSFPIFLN